MNAKERLIRAKKMYASADTVLRDNIANLFPDTDFTKKKFNDGDTMYLKIPVVIVDVDDDEHCYQLEMQESIDSVCGVMVDDGLIWVSEEYIQTYKILKSFLPNPK